MTDKEKVAAESLVDFSRLPSSALDTYISFYDLAKAFPPPISRSGAYPHDGDDEPEDQEFHDTDGLTKDTGEAEEDGQEGGSEEGQGRRTMNSNGLPAPLTGSRLRPRSPPGGAGGGGSGNGATNGSVGKRNATITGFDEEARQQQHFQARAEEDDPPCPSHFYDAEAATSYLGAVAGKHFANQPPPKEGEVVVQFLYRCRAGDKILKVFSG